MIKKCKGCGIDVQCEDETKPGFIPAEVLENREEGVICKRCFRIKNYSSFIPVDITIEDYRKSVETVLREVDVVLYVVDLIDFEGSFEKNLNDLIKSKPVILCINKVDLVPGRKHPSEIAEWVRGRIQDSKLNIIDISILSTRQGYGVNGVVKKLKSSYKDGAKVAVVGVTNVGKSSLINSLFEDSDYLTVSKYPGTTLKVVRRKLPGTEFEIIDTPGIIPKGRISDMVCEECNLKMVPSKEISRMTLKMKTGKILMIGGLVEIKILSENETNPIFVVFAAKDVTYHQTNVNRIQEMKDAHTGNLIVPPCEKCSDKYYSLPKKTKIYDLVENQDIVFKGLGWISIRRGPLRIEVTLPEEAEIVTRKSLIAPKENKERLQK